MEDGEKAGKHWIQYELSKRVRKNASRQSPCPAFYARTTPHPARCGFSRFAPTSAQVKRPELYSCC